MEWNLFLNTVTWFLIFFVYPFLFDSIRKSRAFYPTTSSFSSLFQFVPDRCSIIVLFLFPWKKCLKKIVTASIKISSLCFFFFSFLRQILKKKSLSYIFFFPRQDIRNFHRIFFPLLFQNCGEDIVEGRNRKLSTLSLLQENLSAQWNSIGYTLNCLNVIFRSNSIKDYSYR